MAMCARAGRPTLPVSSLLSLSDPVYLAACGTTRRDNTDNVATPNSNNPGYYEFDSIQFGTRTAHQVCV